jgi:hypothetical protein
MMRKGDKRQEYSISTMIVIIRINKKNFQKPDQLSAKVILGGGNEI